MRINYTNMNTDKALQKLIKKIRKEKCKVWFIMDGRSLEVEFSNSINAMNYADKIIKKRKCAEARVYDSHNELIYHRTK